MMEMSIVFHLSILVGFLLGGFIAILVGAAVVGLHCWYKSSLKDLESVLDEAEKEERKCSDEIKTL